MAIKGKILFFFLLNINLSCYFFIIPCYSDNTDTILQSQQLRDWDHLISANQVFRLEFFSTYNSRSRYLGILYNTDGGTKVKDYGYNPDGGNSVVWVANRNTPIPDASGKLGIDAKGKLKIYHSGGTIIISKNSAAPNASATLLDSGNLVLRELNSDGSIKQVLWQSFDYPTDMLVPGMKIGINFKTGHKWSLTSWMSLDQPALGSYTLEGDFNGTSQLVILYRGNISWISGPFHNGSFENIQALYPYRHKYGFIYTSNEAEKSFTMDPGQTGNSFIMDPRGYLQEGSTLDVIGQCDNYSSSVRLGCVQYEMPRCRTRNSYFEPINDPIYGERYRPDESYNLGIFDCRKICWNNCSCTAYASINDNGTGCEFYGLHTAYDTHDPLQRQIYILKGFITDAGKNSSDAGKKSSDAGKKKGWIWLIIGAGSLVILVLCCCLVRRKLQVKGKAKTAQNMLLDESGSNTITPSAKYCKDNNHNKNKNMRSELQLFSFESISAATERFSITNKLGEGGFGLVYKGKLLDGQEIAVKRLSRSSGQGLVEFKNEIKLIAKLQHNNLVRLLGCCIQGEEKVLVYEYMPNKSLDFFLFDPSKKGLLKWTKRFNIIEGIAQGLLYLHKYSRLKIIHRDLKASNILLDDNLNPKVSDFGMAKIFGINESEANTDRVVGTRGYMSPEYMIKGVVSVKTDVFSFGVLLLEIVSSKKNNSCYDLEHPLNLIGLAWELWKEGRGLELLDPTLEDSCAPNEVMRCIHVGLLCVQDHAMDRPSMSDVVSMLTNEQMQLPTPQRPAFFIERREAEAAKEENLVNRSVNKLSISTLEGR